MRLSAAPFSDLPPGTRWLAVSFFAGWMAELLFGGWTNYYLGLVPELFLGRLWLWQAVTYIFIHGGFWHFLFNTFMLWMLGRILEPEMGTRRFLTYFFACGAAAAVVTALFGPAVIPVIGASGAIYALLGAFAFLHPDVTVYLYFVLPMSARMMAFLLGAMEFVLSLSKPGSGISNITHLGGLVVGLLWLWGERRWKERPRREEPDPEALASEDIDRLLEKVSHRGQASLTGAELRRLEDYARRRGGRA
ncbi:MAG: rhomboid family intramembrane serine protease [Elusimicrobia bacterium]|nr:rhomboid family intramembrane serine protease [Elusimicrobiota bacterium]